MTVPRSVLLACLLLPLSWTAPAVAADPPSWRSAQQILDASPASDWRTPDPAFGLNDPRFAPTRSARPRRDGGRPPILRAVRGVLGALANGAGLDRLAAVFDMADHAAQARLLDGLVAIWQGSALN